MPPVPVFIPIPKGKEMFALSSWRDGPAAPSSGATAAATAARQGDGASNSNNNNNGTPSAAAAAPPGVSQSPQQQQQLGKAGSKKHGGRGQKQRKQQQLQQQQAVDVDDYFVHVYLPPTVETEVFTFELQAQASPLRVIDVGLPTVLFPQRPKNKDTAAAAAAGAGAGAAAADAAGEAPLKTSAPSAAMHLSPFRTPAVHAAVPSTLNLDGDDGTSSPLPAMALPPAENAANGAATTPQPPTGEPPAAPVRARGGEGVEPELGTFAQVSVLFAEKDEAERTAAFVSRRWPTAVVRVAPRSRAMLNASLVLKGLPAMTKTEYVLEELEKLPCTPSYIRLYRGERGVFKNVVFVKYADREAAEDSKVRLERLYIGVRQLRVEFKKKAKTTAAAAVAGAAASAADAAAAGGGVVDDDGAVNPASQVLLQQTVRDLRVSTEHEGFSLRRDELSKGELKLLKQLCQSYGLVFDMSESKVTVKRVLGAGATQSAGPSPALRPAQPPATPGWLPATPAPLRPMDFKGIRHWKDMRAQQTAHAPGIIRPKGPDDGAPAFTAGRGRPL